MAVYIFPTNFYWVLCSVHVWKPSASNAHGIQTLVAGGRVCVSVCVLLSQRAGTEEEREREREGNTTTTRPYVVLSTLDDDDQRPRKREREKKEEVWWAFNESPPPPPSTIVDEHCSSPTSVCSIKLFLLLMMDLRARNNNRWKSVLLEAFFLRIEKHGNSLMIPHWLWLYSNQKPEVKYFLRHGKPLSHAIKPLGFWLTTRFDCDEPRK